MVHISNGWDASLQNFFYDGIFISGEFAKGDFDLIGVSFYPFYGSQATLANLKSTLTGLVNTFGKVSKYIYIFSSFFCSFCLITILTN
jgi:arabinogalactan endo-1,4-beta-galactosidase